MCGNCPCSSDHGWDENQPKMLYCSFKGRWATLQNKEWVNLSTSGFTLHYISGLIVLLATLDHSCQKNTHKKSLLSMYNYCTAEPTSSHKSQ